MVTNESSASWLGGARRFARYVRVFLFIVIRNDTTIGWGLPMRTLG
jgi:hypothetical protein